MKRHKISNDTDLSAVFVVIVLKPGNRVGTGAQVKSMCLAGIKRWGWDWGSVEHVSSRQKTLGSMAGITPTSTPQKKY